MLERVVDATDLNLVALNTSEEKWQVFTMCDIELGRIVEEGLASSIDLNSDSIEASLRQMSAEGTVARPTQVFAAATHRLGVGRQTEDGLMASWGTARMDDEGRGHVQIAISDIDWDLEQRDELVKDAVEDGFPEDEAINLAISIVRSRLNTKAQTTTIHELKHIVDKSSPEYFREATASLKKLSRHKYAKDVGLRVMTPLAGAAMLDILTTNTIVSNTIVMGAVLISLKQFYGLWQKDPMKMIDTEFLLSWDQEVRARSEGARSDRYPKTVDVN